VPDKERTIAAGAAGPEVGEEGDNAAEAAAAEGEDHGSTLLAWGDDGDMDDAVDALLRQLS